MASESRLRLIRVSPDGHCDWLAPSLKKAGKAVGLFEKKNGGIEGLCPLPDGRWLVAAERSERGLLELRPNEDASGAYAIHAWAMPVGPYADRLPLLRPADYSDLALDGERVFALSRNMGLVVELRPGRDGETPWVERAAWSFRAAEAAYPFAYAFHGLMEGLAVRGHQVWLVTDPNGLSRAGHPEDRRPLLFICRMPVGSQDSATSAQDGSDTAAR